MYRHILLPTDGSEFSARAVDAGIRLAKALGARVTALHVIRPLDPDDDAAAFAAQVREHARRSEASTRQALGYAERTARTAGVSCAVLQKETDSPWEEIVKAAKSEDCDLIFMASHGHRGMAALVLGSETHKVLMHSTIPVLVVR
jgi:nucleotide-binding universal stress UspA family protein